MAYATLCERFKGIFLESLTGHPTLGLYPSAAKTPLWGVSESRL